MSYPVLNILISSSEKDNPLVFKWYPSEYLYRKNQHTYCFAAEKTYRSNEIMMGGTLMR